MPRHECCFCGRLEEIAYEYVGIDVKGEDGEMYHTVLCPRCHDAFAASLKRQAKAAKEAAAQGANLEGWV